VLPIADAQKITGHADIRMLAHYYHPTAQQLGLKLREARFREAAKVSASRSGKPLSKAKRDQVDTVRRLIESMGLDVADLG
jgi:hypothetical protein